MQGMSKMQFVASCMHTLSYNRQLPPLNLPLQGMMGALGQQKLNTQQLQLQQLQQMQQLQQAQQRQLSQLAQKPLFQGGVLPGGHPPLRGLPPRRPPGL